MTERINLTIKDSLITMNIVSGNQSVVAANNYFMSMQEF